MRNYALTRAENLGLTVGFNPIARLLRNWRARRSIARLEVYDDYMLRDIGVTRSDVIWAAGLPLTVNAALALEERSQAARRLPRRD